jgi:hypothetical protein
MDGRVGELKLRVRAPADRLVHVRAAARDFAARVIQRCEARLEARARGRVILLRRLDMTWRLLERALGHDGEVEAFAEEMAAALAAQAEAATGTPSPADNLAVFVDEARWRAAHLAAVARGEPPAWYFARLADEGEPPGRLRHPEHRALAAAVLARLAEDGSLHRVLAWLPTAALRDLARSLDVAPPSGADEDARSSTSALVRAALRAALRGDRVRADDMSPAPVERSPVAPVVTGGTPAAEPPTPSEVITTRFGGLFYLIARCLELDVGDILWQVCLSEGVVLRHAAAALLGPAGASDPAPNLFGGVTGEPPLPVVSSEQHAETASALVASLGAAFRRRGLATLPDTVVGLVEHAAGRLLVAAVPDEPFVFFAWPAPDASAAVDGIRAFLASWPPSGPPPRAVPELAELDRSGRLRPSRKAVLSRHLVLPGATSPHAVALRAQVAGSLGALFVARVGAREGAGTGDLVNDFLAIPGEIELAPESMTVRLPLERVDLRVRRAGLDADPGWVPWLGRRVRIVFAEAQTGDPAITREA